VKPNPFAGRQKAFQHLIWLALMPVCVHGFFVIMFGSEADSAAVMLFTSILSAVACGAFLCKQGYGPGVSILAAGWPSDLAMWRNWHWAMGMASPGGSAQSLARRFGWPDPSMAGSLTVILLVAGGAGWLFGRLDRQRRWTS
jgi:hypothetical protein